MKIFNVYSSSNSSNILMSFFVPYYLIQKMLKRYKMCDCFLDMARYCLHINAGFATFKKMCEEKFDDSVDSRIFCILKAEPNVSRATYIACCTNFVDFQIYLFKVMPDTFPLASVVFNYAGRRYYGDVESDYGVDQLEMYYDNDEKYYNSDGSEFNDDEVAFRRAHALNFSTCFTDLRVLLRFTRFCIVCQQIFLLYFVN